MDNILYTILCTLDRQSLIRKKIIVLAISATGIFKHFFSYSSMRYKVVRILVIQSSNMYPIIQTLVLWITIFSDL